MRLTICLVHWYYFIYELFFQQIQQGEKTSILQSNDDHNTHVTGLKFGNMFFCNWFVRFIKNLNQMV